MHVLQEALVQHPSGSVGLLAGVFGDRESDAIWSEATTIASWLRFESALAESQAALGLIPIAAAHAISNACTELPVDTELLWHRTRVVGYPILPLLEQLGAFGGSLVADFAHWGATTQDAMDTGLALQLRSGIERLNVHLDSVGDNLVSLSEEHKHTLIAARTHAQYAVPTTFGVKMAVLLSEFGRHRERLTQLNSTVCVVSMFGAGGTSAAYGESSGRLRSDVAGRLDLQNAVVSRHTARDGLAEAVWVCAAISATCAKLGREVIELSRPEISEVRENGGHLRGASSTMPQKANPISGEVLVGLGVWAGAVAAAGPQLMLAGHERSAGEWQAEWEVIPHAFGAATASLKHTSELLAGLRVDTDSMNRNARRPNAFLMAESIMMQIAPAVGRAQAHQLVYDACVEARASGESIEDLVTRQLNDLGRPHKLQTEPLAYIGDVLGQVDHAVSEWRAGRTQ